MGFGNKIGEAFLKVAKMGDDIDEGLDRVFGSDRTKPGGSVSRARTGKKAANFQKKNRKKTNLYNKGKKSDNSSTSGIGKDMEFFNEKSEDDNDRDFF